MGERGEAIRGDPKNPQSYLPAALAGRFQVERVLGEGAYGRVLLAQDRQLDRLVAVKMLLATHLTGEDTARPRFMREARLLGKLRHPNVTELYDFGVEGDQPYMVTRYVDGPELRAYMKRRKKGLPFGEANTVLEDILAGLGAAHGAGVVHRDLKPANVLLTLEGRAVVADFGLGHADGETTLTQTGTMVGSPIYMCRQQMQGESMHPSWDVFAAAIVFCEMATGKIPGSGRNMTEVYQNRLKDLAPQLVGVVEGITPAQEAVIGRALRQDLKDRLPDAAAFLEAWRNAAEGEAPADEDSYRGSLSGFVGTWSSQQVQAITKPLAGPPPAAAADPTPVPGAPPEAESVSGPSRGRGRTLVLALVVGVLLGLLRPREASLPPTPSPGPAPREVAPPAPVEAPAARLERRFRRVRELLLADEPVRSALDMARGLTLAEAMPLFLAGRQRYRERAQELGLADLVAEAMASPHLDRRWYREASRVHLLQRLLEGRGVKDVVALYPGESDPGLGALMDRGRQLVALPTLTRSGENEPKVRETDFTRFRSRATRWREVRSLEDLGRLDPDGDVPHTGVRLTMPFAVPFLDPSRSLPRYLTTGVFGGERYRWVFAAPQEFTGRLEASERPFVLVGAIQNWDELTQVELILEGTDDWLYLDFDAPPELPVGGRSMKGYRQGFALRVARELLPDGLSALRGRLVGLQPMSTLHVVTQILPILQYSGGPLPAEVPPEPR